MKAVICETLGGPDVLVLRDLPDPPPPGPGEVQVRIRARGAQYVDVLQVAGTYQTKPEMPFIPGGEAAGEIVALGDGVTAFKVGDRVMSRHSGGAFMTLGNTKASHCDPLPAALTLEEGAVFRGAYATAYYALVQKGRMKPGEWVLIHGAAGGIGVSAIQIAKLYGARVIATASTQAKRDACLAQGADHAIDYNGGFRDQVKALTGGKGADIVYDPICMLASATAGSFMPRPPIQTPIASAPLISRWLVLASAGAPPRKPRISSLAPQLRQRMDSSNTLSPIGS